MKDMNRRSDPGRDADESVRDRERQKLLAEAGDLRKGTKDIGLSASELIREDRDAR